jgi:hypothetical protein
MKFHAPEVGIAWSEYWEYFLATCEECGEEIALSNDGTWGLLHGFGDTRCWWPEDVTPSMDDMKLSWDDASTVPEEQRHHPYLDEVGDRKGDRV